MTILYILAAVASIAALYLFMVMPSMRRRDLSPFTKKIIAHRGLHGGDVCENSIEAFRAAIEAGLPIELDVNVSADGECFVIHDDHLLRLCDTDVRLLSLTADEVKKHRLSIGGGEIPTLREVLELVDGRVPLLIELKGRDTCPRAEALWRVIKDYDGCFALQSFNPVYLLKLRRLTRDVPIGFLTKRKNRGMGGVMFALFSRNLLFNFLFRPDFISYKYDEKQTLSVKLCRRMGIPVFGWTFDIDNLPSDSSFDGYIAE